MLEKSSSASLITKETRNSTPGNGTIHDLEKNPNMLEKKSSEEHDGKRESPSLRELQLGRFLKNGNNHSSYLPFLLLMRFVPENNNIETKVA